MAKLEDLIDIGTLAARPAPGSPGRLYQATDATPVPTVYRDTGTTWEVYATVGGASGGGGAPVDAGYLVTAPVVALTGEVVVGTTPGGELGGTWASPTVDPTHSGSSHADAQTAAEATAAGAMTAHTVASDPHPGYALDTDLGSHAAAADPHTGYRLESADHSHATTGFQGGQVAHSALSGVSPDQHHAQAHAIGGADHTGSLAHSATSGRTANDHHNQSHIHDGADSSGTVAHAATTGRTANDHHSQAHALTGADHTLSGLTTGHVLTATSATAAAFQAPAGGGGGAPVGVNYLVGTADATLTAEIVVGTTPGGELGGTWASPTVDATHAGSAHLVLGSLGTQAAAGDHAHSGVYAPASPDYLVGSSQLGLANEIIVGTTPGGELGGTWGTPTVDASHSGSTHAATQAAAEATASGALTTHAAAADPHTGYRLESADHSHATTGLQAGQLAQANTHGTPDTDSAAGSLHHTIGAGANQAAAGNHGHVTTQVINLIIDGAGSAITTGIKGVIKLPVACTLTAWEIVSVDGTSGSIVVELWADSYANFPPTVADLVGSTEKPTLSSATKNQKTGLNTGAGYALTAGHWLMWNVLSAATVKFVSLALTVTRAV